MDRLDIREQVTTRVTVHDACKVALTGLDLTGPRPICALQLRQKRFVKYPGCLGAQLAEMPRSKENAICCGCAAIGNDPPTGNKMLDQRIEEAGQTDAKECIASVPFSGELVHQTIENVFGSGDRR